MGDYTITKRYARCLGRHLNCEIVMGIVGDCSGVVSHGGRYE